MEYLEKLEVPANEKTLRGASGFCFGTKLKTYAADADVSDDASVGRMKKPRYYKYSK